MNRVLSQIKLEFLSFDNDAIENEICSKLVSRNTECEVIFDLTKLKHVFAIIRHTGKVKRIFDKYRDHSDKIIKKSVILVASQPAKVIAHIFLKIAKPSCPTTINILSHQKNTT